MRAAWLLVCLLVGLSFAQEIFVVETGSSSPQSLYDIAGLTFRSLSPQEAERGGYAYSYSPSGVFADKPFSAGDVVIQIPADTAIGYVEILQDIPQLAEKRFSSPEEPFIVWLLYHRSLGSNSPRWDYIKILPDYLSTPVLYSPEFWAHFKDGTSRSVQGRAATDAALLYQYYRALLPMFQDYPETFKPDDFTFDDYLKAFTLISHFIQSTPDGKLVLFPAVQFNHSPTASPLYFNDEGNLVVIASKDIEIGDQIFIRYGNLSNEDLNYQHGVSIANNPHECIKISLDVHNPYWMMIAPFLFNTTTSTYKACVPVELAFDSTLLVHFRTFVAQPEDVNQLAKLVSGERVSVKNEMFALRGLYASIDNLRVAPEDVNRESENPIANFWLNYLRHRQPAIEHLLARLLAFWETFLIVDEVPDL